MELATVFTSQLNKINSTLTNAMWLQVKLYFPSLSLKQTLHFQRQLFQKLKLQNNRLLCTNINIFYITISYITVCTCFTIQIDIYCDKIKIDFSHKPERTFLYRKSHVDALIRAETLRHWKSQFSSNHRQVLPKYRSHCTLIHYDDI